MKLAKKIALKILRLRFRVGSIISPAGTAKLAVRMFCTPAIKSRKELPAIFAAGVPVSFELKGLTVKGYRWNHPSPQKALILHGFNSDITNFEQFVAPLLQEGYEVMAFDAPAHGASQGRQINAMLYCDMIVSIHQLFGPVQSFIGHSLGGLALALAMEKIEHNHETKIVLIAPATESATAFDQFFNLFQIRRIRIRELFEEQIIKITGFPVSWFSITRAMDHIHARVLWIHDAGDTITPLSDTETLRNKNYPALQFVITNGLGHRRIYRDQKVIEKIAGFL